jgi:hypothetical protein
MKDYLDDIKGILDNIQHAGAIVSSAGGALSPKGARYAAEKCADAGQALRELAQEMEREQ